MRTDGTILVAGLWTHSEVLFISLMEQQLGNRDQHHPPQPSGPANLGYAAGTGYQPQQARTQRQQQQLNVPQTGISDSQDVESFEETIAHQKMEIVRLLTTVKTLSSENTKLVKV